MSGMGVQPFKEKQIIHRFPSKEDRDSSVGIATRYGLDGPVIESRWGARFSAPVQTSSGAHPASYTMGTGSFQGVKQPGRGADHPPHEFYFTFPSKRVTSIITNRKN
jgi:hypothetical protein